MSIDSAPLNTCEYTTYAMMAWYSRDKSMLRSSARRSREISSGAADCDSGIDCLRISWGVVDDMLVQKCSPLLHSRLLSLCLNGSLPLGWVATPASSPSR